MAQMNYQDSGKNQLESCSQWPMVNKNKNASQKIEQVITKLMKTEKARKN